MANSLKKRGQKIFRRFSRDSVKASEKSKEHIKENVIERVSHIQNIKLLIFEWILLVTALIMLAMTQAFWFGQSYSENSFAEGGTYTEATLGRVSSMNPLFATTSSERVLSKLMFATLVAIDYSGNPGPALAETLRYSENGRVWTMKLREGLKWSDGEPLTNEDVMFTIDLIQNPAVTTIYAANLGGVKVTENENGEIVFTLPTAYADFATALEIPVVPKHILEDAPVKTLVEDDFSVNPITSGAFYYNARQVATAEDEEVIYLSANPYYYLGKPMLNTFGVHTYGTKDAIVAALNSGAVTGSAELGGLDAEKVTARNLDKRDTAINAGTFMFLNNSGKLGSVKLRQAIRQGVDIAALREKAPGTEALDYPFVDSQIALSGYPEIPASNFEQAKQTIAEAKGAGEIALNVVTVNSGYLPRVGEELKAQLEALGFSVNFMTYDETQDFIANIVSKRNYDILLYEIELGADPDPLPYYHSSQAKASGLNLSNYRNSMVDDLLIAARGTVDTTLRAKKYESFLKYWVEEVPAIAIYRGNMTYIYNKNARIYNENLKLVTAINRFTDVTSWATVKETKNFTP